MVSGPFPLRWGILLTPALRCHKVKEWLLCPSVDVSDGFIITFEAIAIW